MTSKHPLKKPIIYYSLLWSTDPFSGDLVLTSGFQVNGIRFVNEMFLGKDEIHTADRKRHVEARMRRSIANYFRRNKANVILVGPIEGTNGKLQ